MIRADFSFTDKGAGFKISGHSGYAEAGSDIVCAAVSSAVMFMINAGDRMGVCRYTADDNIITCEGDRDTAAYELILLLYEHIAEIEKQYPKYIKVKRTDQN